MTERAYVLNGYGYVCPDCGAQIPMYVSVVGRSSRPGSEVHDAWHTQLDRFIITSARSTPQ